MLRIILLIFLSIEYAKSRHADIVFENILSIDSSIFKALLCLPIFKLSIVRLFVVRLY